MSLIGYDGQIELEEDDWREDECDGDEDDDDCYDEEDEWGCEFGADCLMSSFYHMRSECYTVEIAEAWADGEDGERHNAPKLKLVGGQPK